MPGVYRLWDQDPERPVKGKKYYDVVPAKLGRFPAALVGGIYKGQLILARWRDSSRLYRAEVIGGGEAPNIGYLRVRYRDPDAGTAAGSGEASEWEVRHRGKGRPDCDVVYTVPAEDVTLSPEDDPSEARRCVVDKDEMKRRKKQDKGRLKQEAQEREARLGTAEPTAASPFEPLKWELAHCAHHWLCQCAATVAAEKKGKSAPPTPRVTAPSPTPRAAAPSPLPRAAAPSPPPLAAANAVPPREGAAKGPPKEREREKEGAAKAAPPMAAAEERQPKIEAPPKKQAPSPTPPPQVPKRATPSPTPPLQPPAKKQSPSPPPSQEPRKAAPSPTQAALPSAKKLALSPQQSRPSPSLGTAAPAPAPAPASAPASALVSPAKPSTAAVSHPPGATGANASANANAAATGLVPASAPASRAASPSTSMVLAPPRATFPAAPSSAAVERARSPDAPPSKVGRVRQLASAFGTAAPPAVPLPPLPDPGRLEQQTQRWRHLLGLPVDLPPPAAPPPAALLLALPPPSDGGGADGKPAKLTLASFALQLPRKRAPEAEAFAPQAEAFAAVPAKRPALVKARNALTSAGGPRSIAAPPRRKPSASVRAEAQGAAQGAAPRGSAASREARVARLKALLQATPKVTSVPKATPPLSHSIRKKGKNKK